MDLYFRQLEPCDFDALKAAHQKLFPIDYDDAFFHKAVHSQDRIFSSVAIKRGLPGERDQLVGFVTARLVYMHECDAVDRQHLGMSSSLFDREAGVYILTLGVVDGWRQRGLASTLLSHVCTHAVKLRCRVAFLHVITYNEAAIRLYTRSSFKCAGKLDNFYYIYTGRQPDPSQTQFDAFIYAFYFTPPDHEPAPWSLMNSHTLDPLRSAWGRIHACMPWFCRPEYPHVASPSPGLSALPPAPIMPPNGGVHENHHAHLNSGASIGGGASDQLLVQGAAVAGGPQVAMQGLNGGFACAHLHNQGPPQLQAYPYQLQPQLQQQQQQHCTQQEYMQQQQQQQQQNPSYYQQQPQQPVHQQSVYQQSVYQQNTYHHNMRPPSVTSPPSLLQHLFAPMQQVRTKEH